MIGHFITPDSIVQAPFDPQSLNRYSYCRNNPINLIDPTGHKWSWKKFWNSFAGAFLGVVLAFALGPLGLGLGLTMTGIIAGAAGGALTGGLEGGWKGALIGAGMGAVFGGFGGWAAGNLTPFANAAILGGMVTAGAAYAGVTGNWDSFAGGLAGVATGWAAGSGITSAYKQQFANFRAGNGFRSNAAIQETQNSLNVDKGKTVTENTRLVSDKSTREWQVKDTVDMYKKYGNDQIKAEIKKFELKGGTFKYNENYEGTGQYFEGSQSIEFGQGNWENPWSGYAVGRQGVERTLPHEIYHFTHHNPYAVEEPIAQQFGPQQREILKQNRGW